LDWANIGEMAGRFIILAICSFFGQIVQSHTINNTLTQTLIETKTRIYFLLGSQKERVHNINAFIIDMGFERQQYEFISCVKKESLDENQLHFLIYKKFITDAWVRRYLYGVNDPISKDKNLGRLALMLTLDNAMKRFIRSNFENMLVFEDDVMVNQLSFTTLTAQNALSRMISIPHATWDIQYLGFCYECGNRTAYVAPPVYDDLYTAAVFPLCKHAILMARNMVKLFLDVQTPVAGNKGDWIFHAIACKYDLRVLRTVVPIFNQNITGNFVSALGNNNDKRHFAKWVGCAREQKTCASLKNSKAIAARASIP
jgi:hypothetical protein